MSDFIYESIVNLLKCIKCQKKIEPPPNVCVNGHITCINCTQLTNNCQQCVSDFIGKNHVLLNSIYEATKYKEIFLEKLIQALECPVCYMQINKCLMCINGHGVCRSCALLTEHCPLCRGHYVYNYFTIIVTILNILKRRIHCRNWPLCKTYCQYTEIKNHELNCTTLNNLSTLNNWKLPCSKLITKIKTFHQSLILNENDLNLKLNYICEEIYIFDYENYTFIFAYIFNRYGYKLAIQIDNIKSDYIAYVNLTNGYKEINLLTNVWTKNENLKDKLDMAKYNDKLTEWTNDSMFCRIKIMNKTINNNKNQSVTNRIMAILFTVNLLLFCYKVAK